MVRWSHPRRVDNNEKINCIINKNKRKNKILHIDEIKKKIVNYCIKIMCND